ncbi:hypothetical protein CQP30_08460 [Yersinia pestis]|uniref:HicB-like antitoxin of toxin-antitoxin system domain-containing protein n=12 Tax=Yersinia pseudotuberculosis complex TaxID=1649845 RepID=A0AAX2I6U8_YERPE|nr:MULTISPECIES: type II toxin-antitoxin system HicB family antitoxin [Yersinia pseudotuberculosis complex]EDR31933.1 conserved hypothetical protein [Yersinia pestis biovar Orientalis str. IP275]EFA45911.1 conserved hypothetical protein [Yersinia pestis KIM D27]ERP73983.1 hypothetical protein L327_09035 [Yersinia pestis S3]ERP74714.1 hypothetical protein L328_08965 [Yersinia pestis 24H]AAM86047.1 hypothetical [Yersinia pestis KIM10+]
MAIYPAYVHVDNDGSASGYFPDVKGCIFAINAGEDLFAEASSALDAHFEALVSEGIEIPEAHDMPYHVYRNPCDYADGGQWYNVNIDMSKYDGKVERINVTLPHRLIHQIDTIVKVRPEYASRSNFLAEAARKELQKLA